MPKAKEIRPSVYEAMRLVRQARQEIIREYGYGSSEHQLTENYFMRLNNVFHDLPREGQKSGHKVTT